MQIGRYYQNKGNYLAINLPVGNQRLPETTRRRSFAPNRDIYCSWYDGGSKKRCRFSVLITLEMSGITIVMGLLAVI